MSKLKEAYSLINRWEKYHDESNRRDALIIMKEKLKLLSEILKVGDKSYDKEAIGTLEVGIAGIEGNIHNVEHPNDKETTSNIPTIVRALKMIKDKRLKTLLREKNVI